MLLFGFIWGPYLYLEEGIAVGECAVGAQCSGHLALSLSTAVSPVLCVVYSRLSESEARKQ